MPDRQTPIISDTSDSVPTATLRDEFKPERATPPQPSQQDPKQSRIRIVVKRLLLLCASTIVALIVAELLLRLCVEQETKRLAIYDKDLGWRGRPHGSGVYVRLVDQIRVPFSYNNFGFRDEDITDNTDGSPRVVMLGDSFLESLEVPYQQIFHELVENQLQTKVDSKIEVVALCSQGYSTAQELLAFRRYHQRIRPDVVISVFYSGNDFDDNARRQFAYLDDNRTLRIPTNTESWWRGQLRSSQRWLYESSHLVFLLKNRVESTLNWNLGDPSKTKTTIDDEYKSQITGQLLRRTKAEAEESRASYAIMVVPSRHEVANHDRSITAPIVSFCRDNEIPCLDLGDLLHPNHFFPTDIHLTSEGHAIVADHLYAFLCSTFAASLNANE